MNVILFISVSAQYSNKPLFHLNRSNWLEIIIRFDDCIERDTFIVQSHTSIKPFVSPTKASIRTNSQHLFEMINRPASRRIGTPTSPNFTPKSAIITRKPSQEPPTIYAHTHCAGGP